MARRQQLFKVDLIFHEGPLTVGWRGEDERVISVSGYKNLSQNNLKHSKVRHAQSILTCLLLASALSACGGGDSKKDGSPNQAPVANAGADSTVAELSTVTLDGSSTTDANGTAGLTYSWSQTSGTPNLTITNATSAQATFTAPDVVFGAPQQFTFQLQVSDGSLSSSDDVTITVQEPGPDVTISGTAQYEFVPPNNNCQGLAFPSTQPRPIRGATLQAFDASNNTLIASTVTDDNGNYAVIVPSQINVYLRVRAELKRGGIPAWDVEVRDNYDPRAAAMRTPLAQRPLYVLDTPTMPSGVVDSVLPILATTGWDGTQYSGVRAAAPFAILDTIYNGIQLVLSADANAVFPPLDAFWSINNTPANGSQNSNDDIANGNLTGSFYIGGSSSLFLLGDDAVDTEEFDVNVVAHEWGHYFEDNFSRSDSEGGPHSLGQRIDLRLAFGEGWGTAVGAMASGTPMYCDTGLPDVPPGQTSGFGFSVESSSPGFGTQGWFNEISIARLLYDLFDTGVDGADNDSMGFTPIFNVMNNQQANTVALTSIFSFATELKANNPSFSSFIDALLSNAAINNNVDIFGSNEDNDADGNPLLLSTQDVLPAYTTIVPNGTVVNVCANSQFDNGRDGNKLSEFRYLRFDVTVPGNYQIDIVNSAPWDTPPVGFNCSQAFQNNPDDPNVHRYSDPDFLVLQNGLPVAGNAECTPNSETDTSNLTVGTHIISFNEFRFADEQTVSNHPERACFNVSVTPQ